MRIEFYLQDHGRNMDYDDSKIDDDLDKLLQHIKEEQQNSLVKLLQACVYVLQIRTAQFFALNFK
jgi:hypothetical protein